MKVLAVLSTLLLTLGAVGAVVDAWLLGAHKERLYDWACRKWLTLSECAPADLPRLVAAWMLRLVNRVMPGRLVAFLFSLVLSALVTTGAGKLGEYLAPDVGSTVLLPDNILTLERLDAGDSIFGSGRRLYERSAGGMPFERREPWSLVVEGNPAAVIKWYGVNYICDGLTVIATLLCLRRLASRTGSPAFRAGWLLAAAAIGVAFAYTCITLMLIAFHHYSTDVVLYMTRSTVVWFRECALGGRSCAPPLAVGFLYATTTLLPVGAILSFLGLSIAGKLVLSVWHGSQRAYLERVAEVLPSKARTDFKPFTLLGLTLATLGAILKGVYEIVKVLLGK